jgi:hypothetical protein
MRQHITLGVVFQAFLQSWNRPVTRDVTALPLLTQVLK